MLHCRNQFLHACSLDCEACSPICKFAAEAIASHTCRPPARETTPTALAVAIDSHESNARGIGRQASDAQPSRVGRSRSNPARRTRAGSARAATSAHLRSTPRGWRGLLRVVRHSVEGMSRSSTGFGADLERPRRESNAVNGHNVRRRCGRFAPSAALAQRPVDSSRGLESLIRLCASRRQGSIFMAKV